MRIAAVDTGKKAGVMPAMTDEEIMKRWQQARRLHSKPSHLAKLIALQMAEELEKDGVTDADIDRLFPAASNPEEATMTDAKDRLMAHLPDAAIDYRIATFESVEVFSRAQIEQAWADGARWGFNAAHAPAMTEAETDLEREKNWTVPTPGSY